MAPARIERASRSNEPRQVIQIDRTTRTRSRERRRAGSEPAIGGAIDLSFLPVRSPFPIANLRHVLTVPINVMLVFDEFVLQRLLQIRTRRTQSGQPIDDVHH